MITEPQLEKITNYYDQHSYWKERSGWSIIRHLKLVPYDLLVIIFIAYVMLPVWAALILVSINFGTWWCYHRIPRYLRYVSGDGIESIVIPAPVVGVA